MFGTLSHTDFIYSLPIEFQDYLLFLAFFATPVGGTRDTTNLLEQPISCYLPPFFFSTISRERPSSLR